MFQNRLVIVYTDSITKINVVYCLGSYVHFPQYQEAFTLQ